MMMMMMIMIMIMIMIMMMTIIMIRMIIVMILIITITITMMITPYVTLHYQGQGVISNASSRLAKAKLRLLFEAAPIALIIEAAGGSTCVCPTEVFEPIGR